MLAYVEWIKSLKGKPVFVAYPAGFDFLFVYWYLIRFVGESPFSHSPDGQVKFPHPWPPQIPPGRTTRL